MSDEQIHILSTGDIPGLNYSGKIIVDIIPFLSISLNSEESVAETITQLATKTASVVFTSANAVEAVGIVLAGKQPNWKIYCIAHSTREKVLEYFTNPDIAGLAASSGELAELIVRNGNNPVLFFCGNLRRDEIPIKLRENNIPMDELVVYETVYTPVKTSENYSGILFFSPGAVESFFSENKIDPGIILFAIGKSTASEIREHCTNRILTAAKPGKLELAQKAINYFEEKIHQ
ncbi:MAG: uroporphyrinogen-III synthase [Chitinophagaceae bacterium]